MVQKYYPFPFSNEECGFSDQEKLLAMRNGKPVPKDGFPARIQRRTRLSRIVPISDGHPLRGFPDRGFQNEMGIEKINFDQGLLSMFKNRKTLALCKVAFIGHRLGMLEKF
jgi:hypothetical protein